MIRHAIGLVAMLTIFSACSSDFNLTGEYTEKALIYGLLDPHDNPNLGGQGHLFRIQKAFLGEESAFIMAMNPDSSYFRYEDLFVELVENDANGESNRWVLDTIMIANKDTGNPDDDEIDFFGPSQRLYKTRAIPNDPGNVQINASRTYEISLKKRPAGVSTMTIANMADVTPIASAVTDIVNPSTFSWNTPSEISQANNVAQKMDLYNTSGEFKDYTIRFSTVDRAKQYEVWLRFHYREVVSGIETPKTIEWKVSTFELAQGVSSWQVQISSEGIYSRIGSSVQAQPNTIRYIGKADGDPTDPIPNDGHSHDFDIFVRVAGEELYEYIQINNPTNSGAIQDKPVYTNVVDGLGVFSSRSEVEFKGLYLTASASEQVVDGSYTQGLGFTDD